jgi:hypothetical protein
MILLPRHYQRRLQHLVAAAGRREACTVDRLQGRPELLVRLSRDCKQIALSRGTQTSDLILIHDFI